MKIPKNAQNELKPLQAAVERIDQLKALGYVVTERLTKINGNRFVRIYYWKA